MTPEQEVKMKDALGNGSYWPKFTDDAEVNYEVDRKLYDEEPPMPPWNEISLAEKALYLEEAQFHRRRLKRSASHDHE